MKSVSEHQLNGTFRKDRHGNKPTMKKPKDIPPAPEHLTKAEAKIFNEIAKKLFENEVLSTLDVYTIETYAVQLNLFRKAKHELEKTGEYVSEYTNKAGASNLVPSPWLQVLKNSGDALLKLSGKLGLNPTDRHKASKTQNTNSETNTLLR
jgi:P27 family predicted phage terminase small subunit